MKPVNLTVQEVSLFWDPSRTSPHCSMPGPGGRERARPDRAQTNQKRGQRVTDANPKNRGRTMYGSVTWTFNSFNVITETTPKTTKAVAPSEDWGDEDMNNI